ncbi:MAG: periplasmic heavy metal sensor [Deltaproteobacteria bacterium]|nr:periplasmic heavy metal sensor [Deltaproteobacteria bacterium]
MKKVTVLALVIFLGLLGISSAADARMRGEGSGAGKDSMVGMPLGQWWKMPQMAEKLSLTKEEQGKMDSMYLEHRRRMIDLRSQVQRERLEMEQLLDSRTLNAPACMDRFKKLQDAQNKLATERFGLLIQVRELLGLDRFQTLKEGFQRSKMKGRHGKQSSKQGGEKGKHGKRFSNQGEEKPK